MASCSFGAWMRQSTPSNSALGQPFSDPIGSQWTPLEDDSSDSQSQAEMTDADGDVFMDRDELLSSPSTIASRRGVTMRVGITGKSHMNIVSQHPRPDPNISVGMTISNRFRPVPMGSYPTPPGSSRSGHLTPPVTSRPSPGTNLPSHSPSARPIAPHSPMHLSSPASQSLLSRSIDISPTRAASSRVGNHSEPATWPQSTSAAAEGLPPPVIYPRAETPTVQLQRPFSSPMNAPLTPPSYLGRPFPMILPTMSKTNPNHSRQAVDTKSPLSPPRFSTSTAFNLASSTHTTSLTSNSVSTPRARVSLGSFQDPISIDFSSDEEGPSISPVTPQPSRASAFIPNISGSLASRKFDPEALKRSALLKALDDADLFAPPSNSSVPSNPRSSPCQGSSTSAFALASPKKTMTPLSSGNLAQGNDFVSCSDPLANARADATQTQPVNAIPRAKHGRVSTSPSKRRLLKGSPTKSVPPSRVSAIAKPIQRGASPSVSDGTLPDVDEVIKQGLAKRSHTVIDLTGDDDDARSVLVIDSESEVEMEVDVTYPFKSSPTLVPKTPRCGAKHLTPRPRTGEARGHE